MFVNDVLCKLQQFIEIIFKKITNNTLFYVLINIFYLMKIYLHFIFYVIQNKIYNIFTTNKKTNQEIIQNYMQCFFLAKEALQEDFKNKRI